MDGTNDQVFRGRALSPGIGRGRAVLYPVPPCPIPPGQRIAESEVSDELRRLELALESARRDLDRIRLRVQADVGAEEAGIFAVHEALLVDPVLLDRIREHVLRRHMTAEQAVQTEIEDAAKRLAAMDDPYLRERSADLRDVGRRLLASLSPRQSGSIAPLPSGSVLIAVELLPSDTVDLDRAHVTAIVTEAGGETSHVAILARALGIPAVTAVEDATRRISPGSWVVVDGAQGEVAVFASEEHLRAFAVRFDATDDPASTDAPTDASPCRTRDGERISLCANLGRVEEVHEVRRQHLDGVGLFRTEFLFLDSREPPSFERQLGIYRQVLQALGGLPLTIRTLDLGGDKIPLFLSAHSERNPSLGLRGLRFSLHERRLFETQLRAIAHAAAAGPVRVLFPMVLGDADLRDGIARLREASEAAGGHAIELGAMIETPASVFLVDEILGEVDFVSLGTNDLTQFILAADRDAVDLIESYSVLHPAVLRAIARVVEAARDRGRRVAICGEAAGDPAMAALLVGLGVRELSMSPRRSTRVRDAITRIERLEAEAVASDALACRTTRDAAGRLAEFARSVRDR